MKNITLFIAMFICGIDNSRESSNMEFSQMMNSPETNFDNIGRWLKTIFQNILLATDTLSYTEPVLLPTYLKSSAVIPVPVQKPAVENKLVVYPNPAKGICSV